MSEPIPFSDVSIPMHFNVLDHGYVRFVASMGTDESIIEAARMSTDKGFKGWGPTFRCRNCGGGQVGGQDKGGPFLHLTECQKPDVYLMPGDEKLLEFLYTNSHMSPFEMGELAIEAQAPILVLREWRTHRTQSWNEMSARYTQMPDVHYVPEVERFVSKLSKNKQESSTAMISSKPEDAEGWRGLVKKQQAYLYAEYDAMLVGGVPKEVARVNTPVSRYSRVRMKANLRNWLGFLKLRMAPNAQLEIRLYANAVASIVKSLWPRTYALFEEYDLHAMRMSRSELALLRQHLPLPGVAQSAEFNALMSRLGDK